MPPDPLGPPSSQIRAFAFLPDNLSVLLAGSKEDQTVLLRTDLSTGISTINATLDRASPGQLLAARLSRSVAALTVYQANASTSLFALSPIGSTPRLVTQWPGRWTLADIAPDGSEVLLIEQDAPRPRLLQVNLVDAASHDLDVDPSWRVTAASYGRDRRDLWVGGSSETGACVRLLRAAEPTPRTRCLAASLTVAEIRVSPSLGRIAVLSQQPDRAVVVLLDTADLARPRTVELPLGTGSLAGISRGGQVLTLEWETPSAPPDLFEVNLRNGTARLLRADVRPTLAALGDISVRSVPIHTHRGQQAGAVLLSPQRSGDQAPLPVVVLVHDQVAGWEPVARLLVERGYAVVEPWVSPSDSSQAQAISDIRDWIAAEPSLDQQRAGVLTVGPSDVSLAPLSPAQSWEAVAWGSRELGGRLDHTASTLAKEDVIALARVVSLVDERLAPRAPTESGVARSSGLRHDKAPPTMVP